MTSSEHLNQGGADLPRRQGVSEGTPELDQATVCGLGSGGSSFCYREGELGLTPDQAAERISRSTKILATLGPSSRDAATITDLMQAGVNAFRLNFSHGTHEEHGENIWRIREAASALNCPVAIVQDLQGPKTRIGPIEGESMMLGVGSQLIIRHGEERGGVIDGEQVVYTSAFDPKTELKEGEKIYLSDGRIELVVDGVREDGVQTTVVNGGELLQKKGIAVPDSDLNLGSVLQKDIADLKFALDQGVDFVAISFVKSAADIEQLRDIMEEHGRVVPIIAKLERKQAVANENLEEIIKTADLVMVARGDLGVDVPYWDVPAIQAEILSLAQKHGKPAIVATQMLLSMTEEDRPSRPEVTDVYNAVQDFGDILMMSEETAIGDHPVVAAQAMAAIARRAERELSVSAQRRKIMDQQEDIPLVESQIMGACITASRSTDCIIVCSASGNTARLVAKYRPEVPVYGVSTSTDGLAKMALYRGVTPLPLQLHDSTDAERSKAFHIVAREFFKDNPQSNEFSATLVTGPGPIDPHCVTRVECWQATREEIMPSSA